MRPRCVITGGAGFIGSHLAERLAGQADLVLFDNLRRNSLQYTDLASRPEVEFVEGDIRDRSLVASCIEGSDAVFHLAAIAGVSSYYAEPETTLRVNIEGTIAVVDAVAGRGSSQAGVRLDERGPWAARAGRGRGVAMRYRAFV